MNSGEYPPLFISPRQGACDGVVARCNYRYMGFVMRTGIFLFNVTLLIAMGGATVMAMDSMVFGTAADATPYVITGGVIAAVLSITMSIR